MSFSLYGENGYVGDLASTTGLRDLRIFAQRTRMRPLLQFLRGGAVADAEVHTLQTAVVKGAAMCKVPTVKSTLENLQRMLKRCGAVAIIVQ